jgi:hypothetical protein
LCEPVHEGILHGGCRDDGHPGRTNNLCGIRRMVNSFFGTIVVVVVVAAGFNGHKGNDSWDIFKRESEDGCQRIISSSRSNINGYNYKYNNADWWTSSTPTFSFITFIE